MLTYVSAPVPDTHNREYLSKHSESQALTTIIERRMMKILSVVLALMVISAATAVKNGKLIKLVKGKADGEGIALMYDSDAGKWGTICDNSMKTGGWAKVFCKDLGYDEASRVVYANKMNVEAKQKHIALMCPSCGTSTTSSMAQCKPNGNVCNHDLDVYVFCRHKPAECVGLEKGMRGKCIEGGQCGEGYRSAVSLNLEGKCSDGEKKCCVAEKTISK